MSEASDREETIAAAFDGVDIPEVSGITHARPHTHRAPPMSYVSEVSESQENVTVLTRRSDKRKPVTRHSDVSDNVTETLIGGVRTGDWLSETDFPPLRYAIEGILPEGFALLAGPSKAGKSWLVLDWLLAIAAGGRALGQMPVGKPRRVLYVALEDSDRRMKDRCTWVMQGGRIPSLFHYQTRIKPGRLIDTIREFMQAYPDTAMIVVDTLGRVMPPMASGETTYQRDYRVGAWLHDLAASHPGLTVLAVHHTNQGMSSDFVERVSGTNGLVGAADTILVLSRERNSGDGHLQVTGRDVEEAEYALISNQKRWVLEGSDLKEAAEAAYDRKDLDNLGSMSKDIAAFVAEYPEGVRAKEVAAKFGNNAYKYLRRLEENGQIDKLDRGLYCCSPKKGQVNGK